MDPKGATTVHALLCVLILFAGGAPLRVSAASPLEDRLRSVLDEVSTPDPNWKKVSSDAQAARRLAPQDPRVDYVFGVALLAKSDHQQAAQHFVAARQRGKAIYFPAWQAGIELSLHHDAQDEVLQGWIAMGRALLNPETTWSGLADRSEVAALLGRITGFMELPGIERADPASWDRTIASFEERLRGETFHAYHDGRTAVGAQFTELRRQHRERQSILESRLRERTDGKRNEIEARKQELALQQEELSLTKEELKNRFEQEMTDTAKRLQQLQQDYESTVRSVVQHLSLMERTIIEIDRATSLERRGLTRDPIAVPNQQLPRSVQAVTASQRPGDPRRQRLRLVTLELQLETYRRQLETLNRRTEQLSLQANQFARRREQARRQYQAATGVLLSKDQTVMKWKQALGQAEENLADNAIGLSRLNPESRLIVPATYFPLDWQSEIARISDHHKPARADDS